MATNNKASVEDRMAAMEQLLKEQAAEIKRLKENPTDSAGKKEKEVIEPPKETFTVGDEKYRFTVGQYIDSHGNTVKARDSLKNVAELERLHSIKSGIIQLVKK